MMLVTCCRILYDGGQLLQDARRETDAVLTRQAEGEVVLEGRCQLQVAADRRHFRHLERGNNEIHS